MVSGTLPYGELALLEDLVTKAQLSEALGQQAGRRPRPKLGTLLVRRGALTLSEAKRVLRLQRERGPIDGYVLREKLGTGGMGTVFLAVQKSLEREVALKVLTRSSSHEPRYRARFLQEAKLLARLEHPNLVRVYEAGECRGHLYFAMEYVRGKTTRQLLDANGPFPEAEALAHMVEIARAMSHYAARNIVHRDIKPENILVAPRDGGAFEAKLADLGLSKRLDADQHITRAGKTLGTPLYISPELALGDGATDIRSDLYSLGATFYHLATGEPPFSSKGAGDLLTAHVCETPPAARERNEKLSWELSDLLAKLLEKRREDRFQTPDELVSALERIRAQNAKPGKTSSGRNKTSRRRRAATPCSEKRSGKGGAGLVMAIVLAAIVLGVVLAAS